MDSSMPAVTTIDGFIKLFKAARKVSTPLIAVRTLDPMASLIALSKALKKKDAEPPIVLWDIIRGTVGANDSGRKAVKAIIPGDADAATATVRPADALALAEKLPENSALFMLNAHRYLEDPGVVQAVWNLRDTFKASGQTLIMLTTAGAIMPVELAQDVLVLDEPLPTVSELSGIVEQSFANGSLPKPDDEVMRRATDALVGLAAFPAEQALAMSLALSKFDKGKVELDIDSLWERKRQAVEQTPGLSVWRGGETFDDIGGCENIKQFLTSVVKGIDPPRVVVFIDEIEKAFAGTGTDLSGVKTEMTGTMLTWMQDHEADGCIFIGPPGAAKSAIAKATGATAGVPTVAFDLSAMQQSLVGQSGERLRTALAVVEAISQGRSLWLGTCNAIGSLPPELRRRFSLGTFFFSLPDDEEREIIWAIYQGKYVTTGDRPADKGWTGAEIRRCCMLSYRLQITLQEAATYIVPVSVSAKDRIKALMKEAHEKYISASKPGLYEYKDSQLESSPLVVVTLKPQQPISGVRKVDFDA